MKTNGPDRRYDMRHSLQFQDNSHARLLRKLSKRINEHIINAIAEYSYNIRPNNYHSIMSDDKIGVNQMCRTLAVDPVMTSWTHVVG